MLVAIKILGMLYVLLLQIVAFLFMLVTTDMTSSRNKQLLADNTYYNNMTSVYGATDGSLSYLLTGVDITKKDATGRNLDFMMIQQL